LQISSKLKSGCAKTLQRQITPKFFTWKNAGKETCPGTYWWRNEISSLQTWYSCLTGDPALPKIYRVTNSKTSISGLFSMQNSVTAAKLEFVFLEISKRMYE